jgi:hypothetical protein
MVNGMNLIQNCSKSYNMNFRANYSSLAEGSKSLISGEGMNTSTNANSFSGDFSAPYTMLPEGERNYCLFNQDKVNSIVSQKERTLPYLKQVLETSEDEKEIVEALYIVDRLCDNGTKGIPAMYPTLARFNDTKSANIQTFLAGIYRKTQVPDAFGPLVVMLIRNAVERTENRKQETERWQEDKKARGQKRACHCEESCLQDDAAIQENHSPFTIHCSPFDPNEEIGGAILEYIKNYSNNPKAIDYSA